MVNDGCNKNFVVTHHPLTLWVVVEYNFGELVFFDYSFIIGVVHHIAVGYLFFFCLGVDKRVLYSIHLGFHFYGDGIKSSCCLLSII